MMMKKSLKTLGMLSLFGALTLGCASNDMRSRFPTSSDALKLQRVVLYRNGVGYFERHGEFDGEMLRIKVRKDQINDLLKSLTVVDRKTGKAVSVSMPLDPAHWARAALTALSPGSGSLDQVLDQLRGVEVVLDTVNGKLEGRIVMVEQSVEEPDPTMASGRGQASGPAPLGRDHKITLLREQKMEVVRLSKVRGVTLKDGDLAMQFHRRLDATAGEGMFQQVEVAIRLDSDTSHDLVVSYVVEAPMWKPTYRVVLPKDGKGQALLQAWAVVDNVSGEDWSDVALALTAGEPLAFRYDLHSPRRVFRQDLSSRGKRGQARVAMGETTFDPNAAAPPMEPMEQKNAEMASAGEAGFGAMGKLRRRNRPTRRPAVMKKPSSKYDGKSRAGDSFGADDDLDQGGRWEQPQAVSFDDIRRSTDARASASKASGLTRFDIGNPVTVPDGSSTMVALVNQPVTGEETFFYKPGGGGQGFEQNPYRVVRFRNTTPFVLEPGPISIYSGGSFVGEGISEAVGANTSAIVPFAVEPGIIVTRESRDIPREIKFSKIVRGVIHIESFRQQRSVWKVKAQGLDKGYQVLIRHPKLGRSFKLKNPPAGIEDLPGAYLVPLKVAAGKRQGSIELVEQTPTRTTITIRSTQALKVLEMALVAPDLSAEQRAKLDPIVKARRAIGRIDTQISGLRRQQAELDRRSSHHRKVLSRLKEDKSVEAAQLRRKSTKALEEFGQEGDRLGREMVKLENEKLRKILQLEEMLQELTLVPGK